MRRREFPVRSRAFVAAARTVLTRGAGAAGPAATRPNVLFIAVDDLRASLGSYGDSLAKTPTIDRLARSSRVFNRAYCQQAVCGPSHAAMLTGRPPDKNCVWHNRNLFRDAHPDAVTLPQLFKNGGYHSRALGKVLSGGDRGEEQDPISWSVPPLRRGEGWKNHAVPENASIRGKGPATERAAVPDEGYPDGQLAGLAIETLENLKRKRQPFFLAVGFFKPHLPVPAPKKYWDLYDPAAFRPDDGASRTKDAPDVAYPGHLELGGYQDIPQDERVTFEQARELRHGYVVLWGDHGYSLGEAGHWCKATNFELDTHVPLMIRILGMAEPGVATEALIEYVDVYPTLAALAGPFIPEGLDGTSLVPILQAPRRPGRDITLSPFAGPWSPKSPKVMGYSTRTEQHRYTRRVEWPSRRMVAEELYDCTSESSAVRSSAFLVERRNVVHEPACVQTRDHLRSRMDRMLAERVVGNATSPPQSSNTRSQKRKSR